MPAAVLLAASLPWQAAASTFDFSFAGPGVEGTVRLTYGTAADAKYPNALEVTGISGTFSDSTLGIANAAITGLQAIKHDAPEATNLLAPHDFTHFPVAASLAEPALSFDNLFYPGGSPQTATDYPFHGGFLDIYGILFDIGGGKVVNVWSNGDYSGTGHGPIDWGVAVATSATALDYVGGVSIVPEPGEFGLLGVGIAGLLAWRLRTSRRKSGISV